MEKILIREAKRRREVFENLPKHLEELKKFLKNIDKGCKIFLFGSVIREEHTLISDIDILILTKLKPSEVIAKLRENGFDEPFEFHIADQKRFELYKQIPKKEI